jgi:hypothetical protein
MVNVKVTKKTEDTESLFQYWLCNQIEEDEGITDNNKKTVQSPVSAEDLQPGKTVSGVIKSKKNLRCFLSISKNM